MLTPPGASVEARGLGPSSVSLLRLPSPGVAVWLEGSQQRQGQGQGGQKGTAALQKWARAEVSAQGGSIAVTLAGGEGAGGFVLQAPAGQGITIDAAVFSADSVLVVDCHQQQCRL